MKTVTVFCLFISSLTLNSCFEKNTINPQEAYKYWAGELPSKDVKVINGRYWQSSNWSKEYILYLEIQASSVWIKEFIKQNKLTETKDSQYPQDAPVWFKPPSDYRIWKQSSSEVQSRYFEDSTKGRIFIYEIQL